jgi:hypothetical protein
MTNDELDEVQRLKAQVDQMRGELDDALAALWPAHKRGYLYKMERFPGIRQRLDEIGRIDANEYLVERPYHPQA